MPGVSLYRMYTGLGVFWMDIAPALHQSCVASSSLKPFHVACAPLARLSARPAILSPLAPR